MVATAVTPSHKCKTDQDGEDAVSSDSTPPLLATSSSLSDSPSSNFDFEFIRMEEGDFTMTPEDKLADIIVKWDLLVNNVNKVSEAFKHVRRAF